MGGGIGNFLKMHLKNIFILSHAVLESFLEKSPNRGYRYQILETTKKTAGVLTNSTQHVVS